jgi:hypothetical protein
LQQRHLAGPPEILETNAAAGVLERWLEDLELVGKVRSYAVEVAHRRGRGRR